MNEMARTVNVRLSALQITFHRPELKHSTSAYSNDNNCHPSRPLGLFNEIHISIKLQAAEREALAAPRDQSLGYTPGVVRGSKAKNLGKAYWWRSQWSRLLNPPSLPCHATHCHVFDSHYPASLLHHQL
jgi:hypothetical protein